MGGVGCDREYLFTWPNALTGVMGGEQTALTMAQMIRVVAERREDPLDEAPLQTPKGTPDRPFRWAMRCLLYFRHLPDQDVFYPCDTRKVLGLALETI